MNPRLSPAIRVLAAIVIIGLTALLAIAPEIASGNSCGHDSDFHFSSWQDAHASWQQGDFYPHWTPSGNFNAGEPRFIFYPPFTWMLGAALGFLFPWPQVSIALTWVLLFGAGLATYALARLMLPRGPAAIAGSIAFITSYSLFDAYERTAFGELAGGIWIPLLLLFILRDRNQNGSLLKRAFDGSTVWLALALAGAWFSDVPLGVMVSYMLAAVAASVAIMRRTWAPVIRASAAVLLGLGLTGIYLAPAVMQQKWVTEKEAMTDPGYQIENSWLFTQHPSLPNFGFHDVELMRVSAIGTANIAFALLCALVAWKRNRLPGPRNVWVLLALIPVAVLLLQLPVSLPVWNLLPKLRILQFPWRWLLLVQVPLSIFFACAIWIDRPLLRKISFVGLGLAMVAVTLVECQLFFQVCYPDDEPQSMQKLPAPQRGYQGYDEYAPPYAQDSLVAAFLPDSCLVSSPMTPLGVRQADETPDDPPIWDKSQKSCEAVYPMKYTGHPRAEHIQVDFDAPHAGYLVLRLRSYPAWHIALNGKRLTQLPERKDGLIAVPVSAGQGDLRIDWTISDSDIAGRWLSAISLVGLIALFLAERESMPSHL
ncbi:MAG: hypothetical protein KGN79_12065 [Acidobacteriota bacterium]|nr:hypothetical protein [Acidobacteriota bacterium]